METQAKTPAIQIVYDGGYDYLGVSVILGKRQIIYTADEKETIYTKILALFDIDPLGIKIHKLQDTMLTNKYGVKCTYTGRSIVISFPGAFFRKKSAYTLLAYYLKHLHKYYGEGPDGETLLRFNRIDPYIIVKAKNNYASDVLFLPNESILKQRYGNSFVFEELKGSYKDESLPKGHKRVRSGTIYFGGVQRCLLAYSIRQELIDRENPKKQAYYYHLLKDDYFNAFKVEIKHLSKTSLQKYHLESLINADFESIYITLVKNFFRDFVALTPEGNINRSYQRLRTIMTSARPKFF